jgi:hypothetical protein
MIPEPGEIGKGVTSGSPGLCRREAGSENCQKRPKMGLWYDSSSLSGKRPTGPIWRLSGDLGADLGLSGAYRESPGATDSPSPIVFG